MRMFITNLLFIATFIVFLSSQAQAKSKPLPAQSKNICIGKSKKLMQSKVQLKWWEVDGKRSRKSTWWYKGTSATLQLDPHTANVIAKCRTQGRETFFFRFQEAFTNPITYTIKYSVNCIPCAKKNVRSAVKKAAAAVAMLKDAPQGEHYKHVKLAAVDMLTKTISQVEQELELTQSKLKLKVLAKLLKQLEVVRLIVIEDDVHSKRLEQILINIQKLAIKVK